MDELVEFLPARIDAVIRFPLLSNELLIDDVVRCWQDVEHLQKERQRHRRIVPSAFLTVLAELEVLDGRSCGSTRTEKGDEKEVGKDDVENGEAC
jgi:hypothetical protein